MRRPLCAVCLLFLLCVFVFTGFSPPSPSWDVDRCEGTGVTVKGKVSDRRIKNETFQIFLEDVSFLTHDTQKSEDDAAFPDHCEGLVVNTDDTDTASEYVKIGSIIEVRGVFAPFERPTCEGQFDTRAYYMIRGYEGQLRRSRILGVSSSYGTVFEKLRSFRDRAFTVLRQNMSEKDAGLVAAMTLGDKTGLDGEIKELYQLAGISHVLALSGLHIASVGLAILTILKKSGLNVKISAVIAGSVIALYAVMTGLSTSTVRALIMFVLSVISILLGRTYDLLSAAAVSAMLIIAENPYYIYDSGFLLSFGAVIGIACIYPVFDAIPHLFGNRCSGKIYGSVCVTLSVMAATMPVMGYSFMQISVYSVLINLVVIPLMGIVLFTGFLGIFWGLIGLKPGVILMITHYILSLYELLGHTFTKIPGNTFLIGKPDKYQLITYVMIVAIAVIIGNIAIGRKLNNTPGRKGVDRAGRQNAFGNTCDRIFDSDKTTYHIEFSADLRKKRLQKAVGIISFLFLTVLATVFLAVRDRDDLEIRNVDVGQGDCAVIFGEDVPVFMIDGGSSDVKQVGKYRIVPVLKANRISSVDYCFLTHMDNDHVNGVLEMIEDETCVVDIKNVVISEACIASDTDNTNLQRLFDAAERGRIRLLSIAAGDVRQLGDVNVTCLWPDKKGTVPFDPNDSSIVLRLDLISGFSALFTGDISDDTEKAVTDKLSDVTYLKVAHHGSRTSTSADFLSETEPGICVISVGEGNSYGHPTPETLKRLDDLGTRIYRTDLDGEVIVSFDDGAVKIRTLSH